MPDVVVIGDGPGGLSAALFLAKNGLDVVVVGDDKTAMHWALLKNYLGIQEMLGSDFQKLCREQVAGYGAKLENARVQTLEKKGETFEVALAGGATLSAKYIVLSEGKMPRLAQKLGLVFDEKTGIATDRNARSPIDGVYVVGRSARPGRSQAIISAGDGAAAAIDILSRERGQDFTDWDEPPKAG